MSHFGRSRRLTEGTTGRLVQLLRQGPRTIDDLAGELELTRTAVRSQLTILMGQGVVEPRGFRKGTSKPARMFGVTAEAEQRLSRAYVPVLVSLLKVLSQRLTSEEFDTLMQDAGRALRPAHLPVGTLRERVEAANELLHELGGLTTVVEEGDHFVIEGTGGCPLASATTRFPQVCSVITSLVAEVVGEPVTNCCEKNGRRSCCFLINVGAA